MRSITIIQRPLTLAYSPIDRLSLDIMPEPEIRIVAMFPLVPTKGYGGLSFVRPQPGEILERPTAEERIRGILAYQSCMLRALPLLGDERTSLLLMDCATSKRCRCLRCGVLMSAGREAFLACILNICKIGRSGSVKGTAIPLGYCCGDCAGQSTKRLGRTCHKSSWSGGGKALELLKLLN